MTRFVLFSTQRSGSSWVTDMLNSHPEIACYGALLWLEGERRPLDGAQDADYLSSELARNGKTLSRPRVAYAGWRHLERLYAPRSGVKAIGFKFMYAQLRSHPWIVPYIRLKGLRVVHLVRWNKLDHVLSRVSAELRGEYHAKPGDSLCTPKIDLASAELVRRIAHEQKKVETARKILAIVRARRLEITYEHLVADRAAFREVLEFLEVDPQPDALLGASEVEPGEDLREAHRELRRSSQSAGRYAVRGVPPRPGGTEDRGR